MFLPSPHYGDIQYIFSENGGYWGEVIVSGNAVVCL